MIPATGKRVEHHLGSLKHSRFKVFAIFSISLRLSEQLIDLIPRRLIELMPDHQIRELVFPENFFFVHSIHTFIELPDRIKIVSILFSH